MEYSLFLEYKFHQDLNINDKYSGSLCNTVFADIIYASDEVADDAEDDDNGGKKIGFLSWLLYNQALAMSYGLNMKEIPMLSFMQNKKALLELDYTLISQETIDAIGATTNPNILLLHHFGISADYRNKGIGEQAFKGLIKQMKGKCGYIIVLHSRPEQCENSKVQLYENQGVELTGLETDPEKAQWKLNAFWQRCGFRQFKNYDNVFVCNVEQAVSERKLVMRPVNKLI